LAEAEQVVLLVVTVVVEAEPVACYTPLLNSFLLEH